MHRHRQRRPVPGSTMRIESLKAFRKSPLLKPPRCILVEDHLSRVRNLRSFRILCWDVYILINWYHQLVLAEMLLEFDGSNVGVMASGPGGLRHEVAAICSSGLADNLHFESISFSWWCLYCCVVCLWTKISTRQCHSARWEEKLCCNISIICIPCILWVVLWC